MGRHRRRRPEPRSRAAAAAFLFAAGLLAIAAAFLSGQLDAGGASEAGGAVGCYGRVIFSGEVTAERSPGSMSHDPMEFGL